MSRKAARLLLPLLLLSLLLTGAKGIVSPSRDFYVTDTAGVLELDDKNFILSQARRLEQDTGAQVAVLTVESLEGSDVESYAHAVAEDWGIGAKGEDNGVLILLSTGDRQSRIEVGYGLEGTLTDIMTGRIQDSYMLPYYAEEDYSQGLRMGFQAVSSLVYSHYGMDPPEDLPNPIQEEAEREGAYGLIPIGIILLLLLLATRGGGGFLPFLLLSGGRRGGGRGPGGFGGGSAGGRGGGFGGGGSSRRF